MKRLSRMAGTCLSNIVGAADAGIVVLPVGGDDEIVDGDAVQAEGGVIGGVYDCGRVAGGVEGQRRLLGERLYGGIHADRGAFGVVGGLPVVVLRDGEFGHLVQDLGAGEEKEKRAIANYLVAYGASF
ncbi:hypothetical protein ACQ86N_17245 [Puia sp. P3]|uniref:hypothetical protein n=1 Tax=Puia sp. P3 TaxID=3423952 RepID=UPI003D66948F